MSMTRIGFRGDDRPPEEIFEYGFKSRNPAAPVAYHLAKNPDPDIDPKTAVCFTWRMSVASYFPLKEEKVTELWIYVVNVDVSQAKEDSIFNSSLAAMKDAKTILKNSSTNRFVNTHGRQVLDTLMDKKITPKDKYNPYRYWFAEEGAVKEFKPEDILFAVKCIRVWKDQEDFDEGGEYKLQGPVLKQDAKRINPTIKPEWLAQTEAFLNNEIKLAKTYRQMPTIESGYQPNTKK